MAMSYFTTAYETQQNNVDGGANQLIKNIIFCFQDQEVEMSKTALDTQTNAFTDLFKNNPEKFKFDFGQVTFEEFSHYLNFLKEKDDYNLCNKTFFPLLKVLDMHFDKKLEILNVLFGFNDFTHDEMTTIFTKDFISSVDSQGVFKIYFSWVKHNFDNRMQYFKDMITDLDFTQVSNSYISNHVLTYKPIFEIPGFIQALMTKALSQAHKKGDENNEDFDSD
uniref:BACK domain-containing protein n=1 Tax=Rhabditophanes sp. KR3021 TaxID=114890 RepID=A0AC35UBE1_9BILA